MTEEQMKALREKLISALRTSDVVSTIEPLDGEANVIAIETKVGDDVFLTIDLA